MKIKAQTLLELEIDSFEQKRITIKTLKNLVDWDNLDYWVNENKKLVITKNFTSSHHWSEDVVLRDATDQEIVIWAVLNMLNKKV